LTTSIAAVVETVSVILSVFGAETPGLVTETVLVMMVPSSKGISNVTAKATTTGWMGLTVRSLARMGGTVPGVPAPGGVRLMLPGSKVVFAGRVSDITAPAALAVPLLLTTMV
jgi:hypothetical protein